MKTTIEIKGFIVSVEEENGVLMVSAEKDGDVVEEFTLQLEEGAESDEVESEEDVKSFGQFDEEDDFSSEKEEGDEDDDDDNEDEEEGDEDDDDDNEDEDENELSLESFSKFIKNRK